MNEENHLKTWNVYQSAWGPIGVAERHELLQQGVSDDIVYTDPTSEVHGVEALVERIGKSQEQFPRAHFQNDSFLEHHGQGLLQWTMLSGDGVEVVKGYSFAHFGEGRRLVQATGFFEARKG